MVGDAAGVIVVGSPVGDFVGASDGPPVGFDVGGAPVVGDTDGAPVGFSVGVSVGFEVVGVEVGFEVGDTNGDEVGGLAKFWMQ